MITHDMIPGADTHLDVSNCPFPLGTTEAKGWWKTIVEPSTKSGITPEMKAKYGDAVTGAWKGKALVPGQAGSDQGDFQFVVDKLQVTQGLSEQAAKNIAGKAYQNKYGV